MKRTTYPLIKWTSRIALVGMVLAGVAAINMADGLRARVPFGFYSNNLVISILADEVYRAKGGVSLLPGDSDSGPWLKPINKDKLALLSGWGPSILSETDKTKCPRSFKITRDGIVSMSTEEAAHQSTLPPDPSPKPPGLTYEQYLGREYGIK